METNVHRRRVIKGKDICVENSKEFCSNTSLHGLKYIVSNEMSVYERSYFAVSFILVAIVAANLISNVYAKWQSTPVIVGLNAVPTFITKSPFPAVTVCNLNMAMKSLTNKFKNDSIESAMLQMICNRRVTEKYPSNIKNWTVLEKFIADVAQPCDKMLLTCRFGSVEYNCSDIFKTVVTDEGLCCAFNMVHPAFMFVRNKEDLLSSNLSDGSVPVKWNPEVGYPKILPRKFYPRVAAGTGESLGFTVIMDVNVDEYYCSSGNGPGFKIFLHSPTEAPHVHETGLLLQPGFETKMRITAVKSEAGSELRSIKKEYRQCIFNGEAKLLYYKFYTKRNCEIECDAKLLIKNCDCVSYYLPKLYTNVSTCGIDDVDCVERVSRRSHLMDFDELDCHDFCLPSCFDLTFLPDFFASPISHDGFTVRNEIIQNFTNAYASKNIAIAHMYFKENNFRSSVKTQFIGMTDFLSNTGGLMGLFMGFSFISMAEFFYYAFLRPLKRTINLDSMQTPDTSRNIKPRPTQTRPSLLDYTTTNKKRYNYRSRLIHPPESIAIIHSKEAHRNGTNTFAAEDPYEAAAAPAAPYPYNN